MGQENINLEEGHEDFVVTPGTRGTIVWHGQDYDCKKLPLEVAERMAREDATRYINFSDKRIAREAEAKAATMLPPVKAAAPAAATASTTTTKAAEKTTAAAEAAGASKPGAGKNAGEKP